MKKLELLLPAGNLEKLKWALAYGADAVYAGVPMFSLRARENQFTWESLAEGVEYCHSRGKKIYFTANIYAHNVKIGPFMKAFEKMQALKPDAYIMSDPGLIYLVKKNFPEAEVHLSVQANNTNWAQVEFWKTIGITRVILSRELSLKEVREIHEMCPDIELEFFVHGAICMAYSGRCLLSNYFSHRDPNQGTCSHSCRWEYKVFKKDASPEELYDSTGRPEDYQELTGEFYLEEIGQRKIEKAKVERQELSQTRRNLSAEGVSEGAVLNQYSEGETEGQTQRASVSEMLPIDEDEHGTYIMNSRDICLLSYMQELADAGVVSFKVEGRSKTVNYLAGVGRAYRPALDAVEENQEYDAMKLSKEVFAISNRGYTPGFLVGNPGEKGIYFEKNQDLHEEDPVGIVKGWCKCPPVKGGGEAGGFMARIEVKNRIDINDKLILLSPSQRIEFSLTDIIADPILLKDPKSEVASHTEVPTNGERKESGHGGHIDLWINVPEEPTEYAIIRKGI
ncbi:U32 family peptidase [Candidatus Gracilibacteria bacterium]|nr:U32 family peptidase [Candidatus Gracilibacteria bacterium]